MSITVYNVQIYISICIYTFFTNYLKVVTYMYINYIYIVRTKNILYLSDSEFIMDLIETMCSCMHQIKYLPSFFYYLSILLDFYTHDFTSYMYITTVTIYWRLK